MMFTILHKRFHIYIVQPAGRIENNWWYNTDNYMKSLPSLRYYKKNVSIYLNCQDKTGEPWRFDFIKNVFAGSKNSIDAVYVDGINSDEWLYELKEIGCNAHSGNSSPLHVSTTVFSDSERLASQEEIFIITLLNDFRDEKYGKIKESIISNAANTLLQLGRDKVWPPSHTIKRLPDYSEGKSKAETIKNELFFPVIYRGHDRYANFHLWITPLDSKEIIIANAIPKAQYNSKLQYVWELLCKFWEDFFEKRASSGVMLQGIRIELLLINHHEIDSTDMIYRIWAHKSMEVALVKAGLIIKSDGNL